VVTTIEGIGALGRVRRLVFSPRIVRTGSLLCLFLLAGCVSFRPDAASDHVARVELLALLQTLNADLLSHDSATLTLERWCGDHHLADPPRVLAKRIRDGEKPAPDEVRASLAVDAGEPVRYRHVQLVCGERVLSEADNWYVPSRLTADMNLRLDNSDEPFGKVVKPLGFQRRTLEAQLLWSPLAQGWELAPSSPAPPARDEALHIPPAILRHRAILYAANQQPFSEVVETYTSSLFDFGRWAGTARQ